MALWWDRIPSAMTARASAPCARRSRHRTVIRGSDGIDFSIPTSDPGFDPGTGSWTINLTKALPAVSADVGITGPGADVLIVRRNTGGDYRILNVTAAGTVTFSAMTISNGNAPLSEGGGGIRNGNTGTVNVINSTLSGNSTSGSTGTRGGGIHNLTGGTVNVINCTLSGNSAIFGGGISNESGTVNVTNSTLSGNPAVSGGGLSNGGTMNVTNSTLSGNPAQQGGGGISNGGTVNVTNSTLSGNSVTVIGSGGGIINGGGGTVNIKSSIVALNTAVSGGPDVFSNPSNFVSQGFNMIGKNDGAEASFPAGNLNANGDIVGTGASPVDPKLDSSGLQDNGGPTQTIALLFGSPALDKGTSDGLTGPLSTDQRGTSFLRTFDDPVIADAAGGDGTDIGAFELQIGTPATFGNISTRLRVETGDNVLIGGFIITGTQSKKVMVRAIGPSLPLAGVLADPTLELHDGTGTLITSNDNWMDAPNRQEIIDSTIAPTNDFESAILLSLDPGLYTAIVRGVNNTTGIGLVEAFDLDLAADSILANISTRGLVQTGDDVMIGGFIILGSAAQEVLVRAIGPSLPVAGALADPILELHDKNGATIATNDNWKSTQKAAIIATTIPPTEDAESAILATLTPDAYTAIVRGKNNTTGVALVEAYQLDN